MGNAVIGFDIVGGNAWEVFKTTPGVGNAHVVLASGAVPASATRVRYTWTRTVSFRTFNIVDDFNREVIHIEVDTSFTSTRLVRVFEQIKLDHGLPQILRTDNGPEFLGEPFVQWAKANGMAIRYIQPGKPNQNAYVERFNRAFRDELLDQHLFLRLDDVREAVYWWSIDYNEQRPHDS